ncbi:hypothetical protein [Streptomyces lavendulae]|uniref:hypothetical protein n=1 Tax=Streptomyces lavendulae TaxID=1914 RepID=UPI0031EF11C9
MTLEASVWIGTMTQWSQLTHAYGTAEDVPGLLEAAGPDPENPAWSELWSRLCHQGTVYPASYAALPALADKARRYTAADRITPLLLAASIVASTDRPYAEPDPKDAYAVEIAELIELVEQALLDPSLSDRPHRYVELLEALLAFEGVAVWGEELHGLSGEEFEVSCPVCEAENFVVFGEYGHFSTTDGLYMNEAAGHRRELQPAEPSSLEGLAKRLHARALADGQHGVASKLTYVFGSAYCAECDALFRVDQAIVARWSS